MGGGGGGGTGGGGGGAAGGKAEKQAGSPREGDAAPAEFVYKVLFVIYIYRKVPYHMGDTVPPTYHWAGVIANCCCRV